MSLASLDTMLLECSVRMLSCDAHDTAAKWNTKTLNFPQRNKQQVARATILKLANKALPQRDTKQSTTVPTYLIFQFDLLQWLDNSTTDIEVSD